MEVEELAEPEVGTVEHVGVHGAHQGAEEGTHNGDEDGVKVGSPDLGQLVEGVLEGLHAPLLGDKGITDGPDGCLRREGDDDDEDERNDTAQAEQAHDHMDQGFGLHADLIQPLIEIFLAHDGYLP